MQFLIANKRLAQIIKILPTKIVEDATATDKGTQKAEKIMFTKYLTEAIDRDRAERLGEMIKTTGYQLYETYNRNKQFFN